MPLEESLDLLAKEIMQTGRTYSVFDLAKVCLQGRDRFRAIFECKEQKFFRCREDDSIWLTKEEALRQLWRGAWLKKYYTEVETEAEAPSGSFQSVAKCGISGELLGPPNYHGYQQNIVTLHRERFGHMSLDAYKGKIVMERGEEAVEAWLESMKTVTKWKESTGEEEAAPETAEPAAEEKAPEESAEATETPEAESVETAESDAAPAEESPAADEADTQEGEAPAESEEPAAEAEPAAEGEPEADAEPAAEAPAEDVQLFETSRDVERHFLATHFEKVFEETSRAWVLGDIKGGMLSPGLLTLLKRTVQEEKRYPANLMPIVCRQLSGRHVAVFKWEKKLKVGPSRPHAVTKGMSLSERPQAIIDFLKENSGHKLAELWESVFTEESTDEQKHEWYHDLHWLLNQGHAVLLNDTTLHIAKSPAGQPPQKKAAKKQAPSKEEGAKDQEKAPSSEEAPKEEPKAEAEPAPAEEAPKAEAPDSPVTEAAPASEATPAPTEPEAAPAAEETPAPSETKEDEA